jgi:hypothetical protein
MHLAPPFPQYEVTDESTPTWSGNALHGQLQERNSKKKAAS